MQHFLVVADKPNGFYFYPVVFIQVEITEIQLIASVAKLVCSVLDKGSRIKFSLRAAGSLPEYLMPIPECHYIEHLGWMAVNMLRLYISLLLQHWNGWHGATLDGVGQFCFSSNRLTTTV